MTQRALGKMVVGSMLAATAGRYPDALAFHCAPTGRSATFRNVDRRTNRLAQAFLALGLRKGDVLAFLSSNRLELVEIYFALARTGIVGLPLNYRLSGPELVACTAGMGAKALVFEDRFAAGAHQIRDATPGLDHLVAFGAEEATLGLDYEALLRAQPPEPPDVEIGENDPFYFNLTSGTTGTAKSYLLTHYHNCTLAPFFQALDLGRRDVLMTVFPMVGRVGFGWVIGSVSLGIPNVLASFEPDKALDLMAAHGVTLVNVVPTMGAMLLAAQTARPRDISSLRALVFAGSSLPSSIRERSARLLCPDIYEYYGMNEMGALVLSTPTDRRQRPDSVGKPIAFSELAIVGENGERLGPGQTGEILGRSPMAVTAYTDDPVRSAETFRDSWLHTGDLGYLDEDGFLFVCGRKKDMIVSGGQNVYAVEVEEVVLRCPGVADCAVFGLPDDLWGERVVCVVIPEPGAEVKPAGLGEFCRSCLAGFKIPKEFVLQRDPLPRTSTGKVQKFLLVERFREAGR